MASGLAIGIVPVDTAIKTYEIRFADGEHIAIIEVINQNPIYIDARLTTDKGREEHWSLFEVPPRSNLAGEYLFDIDTGVFKLNVVEWKDSETLAGYPLAT